MPASYRLSFAQEQLWVLDQLRSGAQEYVLRWAFRLRGPLDRDALAAAFARIAARHEILRTHYETVDGTPVQVVDEPGPVLDAGTGIDLRSGAPWHVTLTSLGRDDAVLTIDVHHIAFDNSSLGVLASELRVLYSAGAVEPIPVQYADFAEWQRDVDHGPQLEYWRTRLAGLAPLELPTSRPRPSTWDATGDSVSFTVPVELADRLSAIGRQHNATAFMVYLAGYQLLLSRYSGQRDIGVGVSMAGRDRAELEPMIGLFLNTVVLRTDLSGAPTFAELLTSVRETSLDAFSHQDVPFQRLAAELVPERDLSRNPLFQAAFLVHNAQGERLTLPGLTVEPVPAERVNATFDLSMHLSEHADGSWRGQLLYPTALFDRGLIEQLAENYLGLLDNVAPDVPLHDIPTVAEPRWLLERNPPHEPPAPLLPDLFRAQAHATPEAVAVISGTDQLTYAELVATVDSVAGFLHANGVGVETPVGVAMPRGLELVVALLATITAGGIYVPLPPDTPPERLEFMRADAGVELVLTPEVLRRASGHPPSPVRITADNAAYVMYTSGSTGRPKGVVVTHGGISNRVLWSVREHQLTSDDRVLQKTTIGFDASMWEFLAPLVSGGTVVMAPESAHRDPALLVRAAAEHHVTVLQLVPSVLRLVVAEPGLSRCTALRLVCSAGEPLPVALCEQLRNVIDTELYNTYGPTECSIDSTAWRYQRGQHGIAPIGTPLPGVAVFVVDADGQLAPVGVPGELCVSGAGLARGYLGRGDLTADRFTPHPFGAPGERWYRTGDLARWRADGTLEFAGRLDAQVKVRGVRVEPGEVEAAIRAHPSVETAMVTCHRPAAGDLELAAYVVPAVSPAGLLAHLENRLPAAMIPATITGLDAMPLLPNGKVDRARLPVPGETRHHAGYVAPRTAAEQAVADAVRTLLGAGRVGADDDFFVLGGHSLSAIRLTHRLRQEHGLELTVAAVFAGRTVARIAASTTAASAGPAIVPVRRTDRLATSFGQQRLWFLDQLDPGSTEYLVSQVFRRRGRLDTDALRQAVERVVARHEVLRTRYVGERGTPLQIVDPPGPVAFEVVDSAALIDAACARPFDLATEHQLRVTVVHIGPEEHLIAFASHLIAFDAWSMDVFLRELVGTGELLPVQYADFAAWQRERDVTGQLDYWRTNLAGLTPLELTTDRPRPAERDTRGDTVVVEVPAAGALRALSTRAGATPFVVFLAAFTVLLGRYTGRTDIAVGTPVAGRNRQETADLIGFFVNNLVLRTSLADDPSFVDVVDRVRRTTLDAFANQDVPFEHLVEQLRPDRDLSRNPLFQIMFEVAHLTEASFGEPVSCGPHVAKFDLTLSVEDRADGQVRCRFEYSTALFDRSTIERLAGHYVRLLDSIIRDPDTRVSDLDLLSAAERHAIHHEWPNPDAGRLDQLDRPAERHLTVPELFERQAARDPDAVAVIFGDELLTYDDLNTRANRLAHHLRALGVGPETVVGSCLERGIEPVVTLLAVLKAGGVYVPFDPRHPQARLNFMLADAGAETVVTTNEFAGRLRAGDRRVLVCSDEQTSDEPVGDNGNPVPVARPGNLAYLIYTSGSTGRPKGVMIAHRSYAHHCRVIADAYGISPGERVILLSALTFDLAMDQIAVTLTAGATLVVSDSVFWTPGELPDRLAHHQVTIMEITPAYYREMLESGVAKLAGLKLVNVGADVVTVADAQRWAATGLPGRFLCNYGPTEATITCMLNPVRGDLAGERGTATLHIGRPVAGTRVHVLDTNLRPAPVGVPGELCIGGVRLARGYYRRPELTADRFVPDPFGVAPGARLYRTGDLARYRPDGTVEFLGRLDQQVKIRGFRIELPEIEAALAKHPAVAAAAVVAKDQRLVAYLECDTAPEIDELRAYLRELLPDYMIPSVWTTVPRLPLTSSKKVDRAALPDPTLSQLDGASEYVAPRDPAEDTIAGIWAGVLGIDRVGVHDDFFSVGGHSLLATRVLARLRQVFAVQLPLRCLFEATTVADQATVITNFIEAEIDRLSDTEIQELLSREGVS